MKTDESTDTTTDHAQDDLTSIDGIGPTYANALHAISIYRFADLAQREPDELAEALHVQANVKITAERIKSDAWIDQARALGQPTASGSVSPPTQEQPFSQGAPDPPAQHQHAGFSLFFDHVQDEGQDNWQTRVYHDESGEEGLFPTVDVDPWVGWILEHAQLPVVLEGYPPHTAPPPTPALKIEILDVQTIEAGPSYNVPEKRIKAEIDFRITGTQTEASTAERLPLRVEAHLLNLEKGEIKLSASQASALEPQVLEYKRALKFPLPEVGRYQLYTIILLLPPGQGGAYHCGPTFRVIP